MAKNVIIMVGYGVGWEMPRAAAIQADIEKEIADIRAANPALSNQEIATQFAGRSLSDYYTEGVGQGTSYQQLSEYASVASTQEWIANHGGWEENLLNVTADHDHYFTLNDDFPELLAAELLSEDGGLGLTAEPNPLAAGHSWGSDETFKQVWQTHTSGPVPVYFQGAGAENLLALQGEGYEAYSTTVQGIGTYVDQVHALLTKGGDAAELEGFASLPADTFAEGPPAGGDNGEGEPIDANGRTGPFEGQPVQGFSAVQFADSAGSFWFLSDNGFGAKTNSSDYLLRLYKVDPNFAGSEAGDGSVAVEDFIQLSDPNNLISFDIQNEGTPERLLTGADFDIESFVIDSNGDIWVGEEFGPYLLHFNSKGELVDAPTATPNPVELNTLNGQDPLVIGHRGASGILPEHTLEAYAAAIAQGADFIEPDLVMTNDGVLIARHEPILDDTTNVADVFGSERMSTKTLDGVETTAYFAEDFTLKEIKMLRAVQSRDFRSQDFDGAFEIPTFKEVIELVQAVEAQTGQIVGIYPETKHPTFFNLQGLSLEEKLISTLKETDFTDPERLFIQSFEFQNLIELQALLEDEDLGDIPLVQLYGNATESANPGEGFSVPYDIRYNVEQGNDLAAIYGQAFLDAAENTLSTDTLYSDLDNPEILKIISEQYAEGAGPWKNNVLLRDALDTPVDGDDNGVAEIMTQLTGDVTSFVDDAHGAGLQVHPYTLRNEERFLTLKADGTPQTPEEEIKQLIDIGVDGFFIDFPGTGDAVRDQLVADEVRSPDNPDVLAGDQVSNLPGSRGFEGMAISPDRMTLYPLLEGTVAGDPEGSLRIYKFDIESSEYRGLVGRYQLDDPNHAIGDFTVINDNEYLVIERDGNQGDEAAFKKIFKVDLSQVDDDGFVQKEELVDLLDINDPNDLNGDGDTGFNFPFVTIENVLVVDADTLLVANDNNYPFSVGRGPDIDNSEIIQIKLNAPLDLDPRVGLAGLDGDSFNGDGDSSGDESQGGHGRDVLTGGLTDDDFSGGRGDDTITGGQGDDDIPGGRGNDLLEGEQGDDDLHGGRGQDTLNGNEGSDIIVGGREDDLLTGGMGEDLFTLTAGYTNTITDFVLDEDALGLMGGLSFELLDIVQGAGAQTADTLISVAQTDDLLAILSGVQADIITSLAFELFVL